MERDAPTAHAIKVQGGDTRGEQRHSYRECYLDGEVTGCRWEADAGGVI
jgi:hypothetical protein